MSEVSSYEHLEYRLANILHGHRGLNVGIGLGPEGEKFFNIILLYNQKELNEVSYSPYYGSLSYDGDYLGRMTLDETSLDIMRVYVDMPDGEGKIAYLKSVVR